MRPTIDRSILKRSRFLQRNRQSLSLRTNLSMWRFLRKYDTQSYAETVQRLTTSILQYSERDTHTLFTDANLRPIQRWVDQSTGYSLWLLERPPFSFPLIHKPTSQLSSTPFGVPSFKDFQDMWAAWDFITLKMIPDSMMFEKPIDLRHICLFYCGHIPTFLDIHLSRLLGEPHTEPEAFKVSSPPFTRRKFTYLCLLFSIYLK